MYRPWPKGNRSYAKSYDGLYPSFNSVEASVDFPKTLLAQVSTDCDRIPTAFTILVLKAKLEGNAYLHYFANRVGSPYKGTYIYSGPDSDYFGRIEPFIRIPAALQGHESGATSYPYKAIQRLHHLTFHQSVFFDGTCTARERDSISAEMNAMETRLTSEMGRVKVIIIGGPVTTIKSLESGKKVNPAVGLGCIAASCRVMRGREKKLGAWAMHILLSPHWSNKHLPHHTAQKLKQFTMTRTQPNIIVTGTPGVGKSSHCEILAQATGLKHFSINQIVKDKNCHDGYDDELKSWIVDEDKLLDEIEEDIKKGGYIIDWHVCDIFPKSWIDLVVVLRADSTILYDRLKTRNYPEQKLQENLDAEIMQVILEEAKESYDEEIVVELQSNDTDEIDSNVERISSWLKQWSQDHPDGI